MNETIKRITWAEFRESGLLWAVNRWLHLFGVTIVIEVDDTGEITDAYPALTSWRGFTPESEARGFERVAGWVRSRYVKDAPELGPIALAKINGEAPEQDSECRTSDQLGSTVVTGHALQARRPGLNGTFDGIARGVASEGDLWWVLHEDGTIGAYTSDEVEDRPSSGASGLHLTQLARQRPA